VEADEVAGLVIDHRVGDQPFGPYAERWVETRRVKGKPLSPMTVAGYKSLLRRYLLPAFGTTPIRKMTPDVVRTWYAQLAGSTGQDAAAKSYRLLRAVLNTAVSDDIIARNPCRITGGVVHVQQQAYEVSGRGRVRADPKSEAGRRTVVPPTLVVEALEEHIDAFAQRHHAATVMARMPGITTKELMARIGHSSPRAALIYQHATQERDRAIAVFLDKEIAAAQQAREAPNVTPIRERVWARSGPVVGQSHRSNSPQEARTPSDQGEQVEAAPGIEPGYRALQARYGADEVPGQPVQIYSCQARSERKWSGPGALREQNQALAYGRDLRLPEDVVGSDAAPDDVSLSRSHRLAVPEGRPTIRCPAHLEDAG
jgi:hypothetical protein